MSLKVIRVAHTRPCTVHVFEVTNDLHLTPFQTEKWLLYQLLFKHVAGSKFKEDENIRN